MQTTASSDPTKVDVAVLGGAGIGGHSIQVNKLASSAQHGFSTTPATTAGKLSFYYGSDPDAVGATKVDIAVAANATATDIATAINAQRAGARSTPRWSRKARPSELVFSSRKTGENADFTVDTSQLGAGPAKMAELPPSSATGATLNADDHGRRRTRRPAARVQRPRERRSRASA